METALGPMFMVVMPMELKERVKDLAREWMEQTASVMLAI
jgi:hypothetical protein